MAEDNKKKASRPKRGLGKGLNALFGESGYEQEKNADPGPEKQAEAVKSEVTVKITSIITAYTLPNTHTTTACPIVLFFEAIKQYIINKGNFSIL